MLIKLAKKPVSQMLVELALILPALFLIIIGLVEFGSMLQEWLTVQHYAQAAPRYASTGQEWAIPALHPHDSARQVAVKAKTLNKAIALNIQPSADLSDSGDFHVYVYASDLPG